MTNRTKYYKPPAEPDPIDSLRSMGAAIIANRIDAYWAARGYDVKTRIEKSFGGHCRIRSDMVNGMPVRKAVQK